jgi:hypothetical protein
LLGPNICRFKFLSTKNKEEKYEKSEKNLRHCSGGTDDGILIHSVLEHSDKFVRGGGDRFGESNQYGEDGR